MPKVKPPAPPTKEVEEAQAWVIVLTEEDQKISDVVQIRYE